jgi:hypothetical protein
MPAGEQQLRQRRRVVDLAVADHLHRAVLVAERLAAALDVVDREASHAESDLALHELARGVRARWIMTSHMARTRSTLARSPAVSRSSPAIPPHRSGRQSLPLHRRREIGHRRESRAHAEPRERNGSVPARGARREVVAERKPSAAGSRSPPAEVRVLPAAVRVAEVAHRRADRGRERVARLGDLALGARGLDERDVAVVTVCAPIVQPRRELADLRPVEHRPGERADESTPRVRAVSASHARALSAASGTSAA